MAPGGLTIDLTGATFSTGGDAMVGDFGFDDTVLGTYTVVPEPASLGLLGLTGLALIRRR